jgi:hypothetical protein
MLNQVQIKPIAELLPYARNPRTHSDAQIAQAVERWQRFTGQVAQRSVRP